MAAPIHRLLMAVTQRINAVAAETTHMWRRPGFSPASRALERFNDAVDRYLNVLVSKGANALVPQYMCLLRDLLLKSTLRRYLLTLSPRLTEDERVAAEAASERLIAAASSEVRYHSQSEHRHPCAGSSHADTQLRCAIFLL